ncbi:MAG: Hsp70 family protein, partial [Pirellulales bacterium]|nr:Hsp70 family protein [Pirellulales bacterium]
NEDGELIDTGSGLDAAKSKGRLVGTLPFMSPEQLENPDSVDPRSDIYSLGATLFFLLHARPPYSGEYLDQVYGHRHGEIPDLMQTRDDVDLKFANIFRRMMAKSPDQRYASLDEVIDDLGDYTDHTDTPSWLAEFTQRQTGGEMSTVSGGSTSGLTARVLAIELGMFYSATAEAAPTGEVSLLTAGSEDRALFRMAIASEDNRLVYGNRAMERRAHQAQNLVHCLPMYIGKPVVEREIAGRQCPPEVLLAMMIRRIKQNAWKSKSQPAAAAITVPASYDQLHRQSVLQAAKMAGLSSVRLVDRSVAAVQTLLMELETESLGSDSTAVQPDADQWVLFVGVTGQATETAVIRRESSRLDQLATAGHWHIGTLIWLHRLVDLAASAFVKEHRLDPRKSSSTASSLQIACEKAMNSLLLMESVRVSVDVKGVPKAVAIDRQAWIAACEDLIVGVRKSITQACDQASVGLLDINLCVTMGPVLRIAAIREAILRGLDDSVEFHAVDRADVARGAAACLAGELPGRGDIAMPPRCVTGQAIGIVVEDVRGRRRILPIVPRGTSLPARTNRRLTVGKDRATMTLSLVESSGIEGDDWHSLGRYDFEIGEGQSNQIRRTRMIGFEVDMNGRLNIRAQEPGAPGSKRLPALPAPVLGEEDLAEWTQWLEGLA